MTLGAPLNVLESLLRTIARVEPTFGAAVVESLSIDPDFRLAQRLLEVAAEVKPGAVGIQCHLGKLDCLVKLAKKGGFALLTAGDEVVEIHPVSGADSTTLLGYSVTDILTEMEKLSCFSDLSSLCKIEILSIEEVDMESLPPDLLEDIIATYEMSMHWRVAQRILGDSDDTLRNSRFGADLKEFGRVELQRNGAEITLTVAGYSVVLPKSSAEEPGMIGNFHVAEVLIKLLENFEGR